MSNVHMFFTLLTATQTVFFFIMALKKDSEVEIFIATKTGAFKHIKYHTDRTKNNESCIEDIVDTKTKNSGITWMDWSGEDQTEILIGRKNQQIQRYDILDGFIESHKANFGTGDIVGLGRMDEKLVAGLSGGVVKIWGNDSEELVNVGKIDRMRVYEDDDVFATGGEKNVIKLWSIGRSEPIFVARNLPYQRLKQTRKVWVSDLCFLNNGRGNLIAECSKHGYVRLYDTRHEPRPVTCVDFEKMTATCITNGFRDHQVLVGFNRGYLHNVDLRTGKPDLRFYGSSGAITGIATDKKKRLVISVSLDEYLKVHRFSTTECVHEQLLTSKLACVLAQSDIPVPLKHAEKEMKEEVASEVKVATRDVGDSNQLIDEKETVGENPSKKKLSEEEEMPPNKKMKTSSEGKIDADSEEKTDNAIQKLLKSTEHTQAEEEKGTEKPEKK